MSRSALHALGSLGTLLVLSLTLSACGDSGASQEELDRARTEGAAQAQQQAKIERIEQQVKALKKGPGANRGSTSVSSAEGGSSSCGGGLSVGPSTTCAFAENVENDYYAEIGVGPGTVVSYSPATERLYSMYCTAGTPHECTGGNNASVFFP